MPPVALSVASAQALPCPRPAAEQASTLAEAVSARPRLRLVTSSADETAQPVHGHGGPASCRCRACVMARHPASMPRLTVVR